jgi:type I restriction-modification system DNA methylase subunit
MPQSEANFDLYIYQLLQNADIEIEAQGGIVPELKDAFKSASKKQTGKVGRPEFTAVVEGFPLVIEDKPDRNFLKLVRQDGKLDLSPNATERYALNGALYYANKIIETGKFNEIFAFGNAGDSRHHVIQPLYVNPDGYKELIQVKTFDNFSKNRIITFYEKAVLGKDDIDTILLEQLLKNSRELHELLRNYGSLGESEKPLVVSAIILALREQDHHLFSLKNLKADDVETDGERLFQQLENNLKRAKVKPEVKLRQILNQFNIIKDRLILSLPNKTLGTKDNPKTPLRYFSEFVNDHIHKAVSNNSAEDILGRFYGEFVSYSGGDGQSLGVVLTPRHITELFCDLVDLRHDDVVFDPCCGTGGFLISAMHRLLGMAKDDNARRHVKSKQLHGIESREDMFAIATTNMILRGDGQSNLICGDFFAFKPAELQIQGGGLTVGLMNPPYSQAKNDATHHLSELNFIFQLLESLTEGGRAAVIVPVSAMIGKNKRDQAVKSQILDNHTLEGVINFNKDTFYRIGTIPCAAVFTAGIPHSADKIVRFINFEDDGYETRKHLGLFETERAKDRRAFLLDCWRGKLDDVASNFMIKTNITDTDEWIHSFFYYNDEIPSEEDFINTIADYLTFEFNMITHGRGYLFDKQLIQTSKNKPDVSKTPNKEKKHGN